MKPKIFPTILAMLLLPTACSKDQLADISLDQPEHISLSLLREKMPDVYKSIDYSSFRIHDLLTSEGATVHVEGYDVRGNGTVTGFYAEIDGRQLYTTYTNDRSIAQYDLRTDRTMVVPRVFDEKQGRLVPDPTQIAVLNGISKNGTCENLCMIASGACIGSCLGIVLLHGYVVAPLHLDAIEFAIFSVCRLACLGAFDVCISLCP